MSRKASGEEIYSSKIEIALTQVVPVVTLLVLVACGTSTDMPTPTSTPTETPYPPTPTSSPTPHPTLTPTPTPSPKVIWFLLDRSKSMENSCKGKERQILEGRYQFLSSLGAMIGKEKPDTDLYLAVVEFGNGTSVSLPPVQVSKLVGMEEEQISFPRPEGDKTNNYAEALKLARSTPFPWNGRIGQRVIVLFTDGTKTWKEENAILRELNQLGNRDNLHTVLCNDSINPSSKGGDQAWQFWSLRPTNHTYLIEETDWLDFAEEIMGEFLPEGTERIEMSKARRERSMPGDTIHLRSGIVVMPPASPSLTFNLDKEPGYFREGKWPGQFWISTDVHSIAGCREHSLVLDPLTDEDILGFHWLNFEQADLSISSNVATSVNNRKASLTVTLDSDNRHLLRNDCYRLDVFSSEACQFKGNGSFEQDFQSHWEWQPNTSRAPKDVKASVIVRRKDGSITARLPLTLPVRFQPDLETTKQTLDQDNKGVCSIENSYTFVFSYVPPGTKPTITASSTKAGDSTNCQDDGFKNIECPGGISLEEAQGITGICTEKDGFALECILTMGYSPSECGEVTVTFDWPDIPHLDPIPIKYSLPSKE